MKYVKLVKKPKVRQCWSDKTKSRLPCPKCKVATGHRRSCSSPENLCRHLAQSHTFDKNEYPSVECVVAAVEEISIALQENIPLSKIPSAVKLGLVIR